MNFKKGIFLIALTLLTTTSLLAKESACHTDGCVSSKNARMDAVIKFMNTYDDCIVNHRPSTSFQLLPFCHS